MKRLSIAALLLADRVAESKPIDDGRATYNLKMLKSYWFERPKESWQNSGKRNKPRIK